MLHPTFFNQRYKKRTSLLAHGYRARFNVAIRTAVIDRSTGNAVFGSGGGITWDSDPDSELAELTAKARILAALAPASAQGARRSISHTPSSRR